MTRARFSIVVQLAGMRTRLILIAAAVAILFPSAYAAERTDIYSTARWEISGPTSQTTWIEIFNGKEVKTSGVAHISVHARKKGQPVWEACWICPHIAITTEALKRSVIHPYKGRGMYPAIKN